VKVTRTSRAHRTAPLDALRRAAPAVLAAILAAGLFAGCGGGGSPEEDAQVEIMNPDRVVGLGRIEPELKFVDLTSEVWGKVKRIHVDVGGRAKAGAPIVELEHEVESAVLKQAVSAVHVQRAAIEAARAALASAIANAENVRADYERVVSLYETDAEPEAILEDAATELETRTQEVQRLEASLRSAQALHEQAKADSMRALAELHRRFLKAPADGRVLALDVTLGSVVSPEAPIGAFELESPVIARCEIDELFAGHVEVGQTGHVRYQGSIEPLSGGRVAFVGPYLRKKSLLSDDVGALEDRRVREVHMFLDDVEGLLLGSRIECVIDVGK